MACDANRAAANFHVPPPQWAVYVDPYDLYDMDEVDEEEMEEMKKVSFAWLQNQGYTHVLRHGRSVCPYCNLAHRQWGFCDILQHASGIGCSGRVTMESRGRHHALEEYLCTDPHFAAFRRALGMAE
ncbi:hypothetical protein PVAP13_7NG136004 [Panicum virgatum]|uniref:Zinc finger-XS domain-containing protein n=1 Tax=Panicum virgatum TaxID=38727 RepID=A0A8T0PYU8_PANVG|nr:hypothetical protein PVAP13_7NG136004 [Panicum virgatum]